VSTLLQYQLGIGYIEQDFALIKLESLHFGVYNYQLETYNSIPTLLMTHIYEMYYINQYIVSGSDGGGFAPNSDAFYKRLAGNMCQQEQLGIFSPAAHRFQNRGNRTYCENIDNGVLTNGYMSSVVHYLEQANRNFLANTMTVMYSPAQKVDYLNNAFNTNTTKMTDYFILICQGFLANVRLDYDQLINWFILTHTIFAGLIIAVCAAVLLFFRDYYLSYLTDSAVEIRAIMGLISCRTVLDDEELRTKFTESLEVLKALK
jgi:hypothetical protein